MEFLYNGFVLEQAGRKRFGSFLPDVRKAGKDVKQLTSGNEFFQYRIMLRPDEVKDFVRAASKCDFDIDISYNRYVVDAKSILGVLGLDLRRILTVLCHGYSEEFDGYVRRFLPAG